MPENYFGWEWGNPLFLVCTTVKVKDSANVERYAPLFFVSPGQINYRVLPGAGTGAATRYTQLFGNAGFIWTRNPFTDNHIIARHTVRRAPTT